jgi:non-heme chloroperoxidase
MLVSLMVPASCQQSAPWHDPSPHRVQFVTVERGVQLEVLDWGGTGLPAVLLAGYDTAHMFDDFAVKLSGFCHVYGITRRGFGASSRPDKGYTAQRSADDVLQVLDKLKIVKPVLAGHSLAGEDLDILGAKHSERISGLVYLDSAEDATLGARIWSAIGVDLSKQEAARKRAPAPMRNAPPPPDYRSFQAYRDWQMRTHGVAFPESELRQLFASNPDGSMGGYLVPNWVRDAMFAGVQKPDYARIRVPVLAFFAIPPSLEQMAQRYKPQNAEERAAMEELYAGNLALVRKHVRDLQSGVPAARVIELPGANHYIFASSEADVLREMRPFLASLR